jgi:uncharacterized damage-inducible protein DinB
MTPDEIQALYEFDAWANRRILEAAGKLSAEQFTRDMGSSFRSVRDTLVHMMGAQWVWLERWKGRTPAALPEAKDFATIENVLARWTEVQDDLLSYVRGLTTDQIGEIREYKTQSSGVLHNPLWQALQHLVNHGTYHRGQVTTMLRQLGASPVSTDLIVFYREKEKAKAGG